jgi:hypothetical protein
LTVHAINDGLAELDIRSASTRASPAKQFPSWDCGVVFCGGGPAATGAIVCASQDGRLDELLDRGICVIEQGETLAAGSIGHYRIVGNTTARSFVRWLDDPEPRRLFATLVDDPATKALVRTGTRYPPLRLVRPYLERLGEVLQHLVESHERCTVALRTSVRSVHLLAGGGVRVTAEPVGDSADAFSVTAENAVIAMGGCEPPDLRTLCLLPGLTLAECAPKLCHASALIDERLGIPAPLAEAVREAGAAVVVGGSHSAWSAAWLLVHDPAFRGSDGNPPTVTVLHRRPVSFFYATVAEARAENYGFDEVLDVCPSTGRVYHWAGLRAPDARALALAAVRRGSKQPPVRALRLVDEPEVRRVVRRTLDTAGLVVAATGYRARLPDLAWHDGVRLEPGVSESGVIVTPETRLVTADGTVVRELFLPGLGAGLGADSGLACEPSYTGRLDAVRLYQNEVGRVILRSLLGDRKRVASPVGMDAA